MAFTKTSIGDFNGDLLTFPKVFQQNGYETAVIGKWHLGTTRLDLIIQGLDQLGWARNVFQSSILRQRR